MFLAHAEYLGDALSQIRRDWALSRLDHAESASQDSKPIRHGGEADSLGKPNASKNCLSHRVIPLCFTSCEPLGSHVTFTQRECQEGNFDFVNSSSDDFTFCDRMGREGGELVVFANRLKAALAAAEKTQRDVARLLNVAESTVSQWVSGKRLPDLPTAAKLASLLNVSVDYLMGRTDDPQSVAQTIPDEAPNDELYVVFRGKRQELSPEYKRVLIDMMEAANRRLREEQEKKK